MKERPILFSAPMVRAILDGRKTMTRRVVRPYEPKLKAGTARVDLVLLHDGRGGEVTTRSTSPYGVPGDRLWVRETWAPHPSGERTAFYRATLGGQLAIGGFPEWEGPWRPSIHMPRWASRITLEVTDVRVERVQEISGEEVEAEGCSNAVDDPLFFPDVWNQINGPGAWERNDWVWVVGFRRL